MRINYRIISILLFSLAVSICAGSFFEASMTGSGKDSLEKMLSGFLASGAAASFAECFFKVFVKFSFYDCTYLLRFFVICIIITR